MNLLFMTLMYPDDLIDDVAKRSRDGLQMQINSYQRAFVEGIRANLGQDERLSIVNSLPVGIFPTKYKRMFLKSFAHGADITELGCLNLPWFKQRQRERGALNAILRWARQDDANRTVLLYTLYLPYMRAVARAKKLFPDLRAAVIVTDLPNELGISSGRKGLLKKAEYKMGDERISLCRAFDGFVLLTAPMAQVLDIRHKPKLVLEGLISDSAELPQAKPEKRFTVLYSGTLNRELGIGELIEAFTALPECDLWLCGRGDIQKEAAEAAARYDNIQYFGFVPQQQALALQARASALINPRSPGGTYTRYSFPSKTLEYLRAAKPVLCYKLEGIPDDYDPYLRYIVGAGADGIRRAVLELSKLPQEKLQALGADGRAYVLAAKNPKAQTARMLELLRSL